MTPNRPEIKQCPNCQSQSIDKYCSNRGQKIYRKCFTFISFIEVVSNASVIVDDEQQYQPETSLGNHNVFWKNKYL